MNYCLAAFILVAVVIIIKNKDNMYELGLYNQQGIDQPYNGSQAYGKFPCRNHLECELMPN